MTVEPIVPDTAAAPAPAARGRFFDAVAAAGEAFDRAASAEAAFAKGHGGLLAMTLDRAQADIVLSVASAAGARCAAALATVFNMQV